MDSQGKKKIIVTLISASATIIAALIHVAGPAIIDAIKPSPPPYPSPSPPGIAVSTVDSYVRMIAERGLWISNELQRLPHLRKSLHIAKTTGRSTQAAKLQQRVIEAEANIQEGLTRYGILLSQLADYENHAVNQAFTQHYNELLQQGATVQSKACALAQRHFDTYCHTRILDIIDWQADLESLRGRSIIFSGSIAGNFHNYSSYINERSLVNL